jgi:hypothetical protein
MTLEEILIFLHQGASPTHSFANVLGPTIVGRFVLTFILFMGFLPYAGYISIADIVGAQDLFRLLFLDRSALESVRQHLMARSPPDD